MSWIDTDIIVEGYVHTGLNTPIKRLESIRVYAKDLLLNGKHGIKNPAKAQIHSDLIDLVRGRGCE